MRIDFLAEGELDYVGPACSFVLYKICQEALTNAVRHGEARNVTIILKEAGRLIRLIIIDDGHGCREIKKGAGLSGMEQRVKTLNGEILFHSDGESMFTIAAEIPAESAGA